MQTFLETCFENSEKGHLTDFFYTVLKNMQRTERDEVGSRIIPFYDLF